MSGPCPESPVSRRCSTRLLSASVHQVTCHVSRWATCHAVSRITTDVSRAADTQAAAAGAARGEGGGAGGQEQGVLQEAEVLRVLHRLRHHRLLLQYVVPAPAAQLATDHYYSVFSLYMVLSYGFNYFWTPEYNIINVTASQNKKVGEKISLMCQADDFWEWCRRVRPTFIIHNYRNTIICATQLM